ncbi:hypothetical protein KJ766_00300 [Patescibacteria group bacterium]|nr:hypothetical protein [Patescibacteria group bacterium]
MENLGYTGKGLREMWRPDMTDEEKKIAEELRMKSEEYLIANQFINRISLDNIIRVK